MKLRQLIQCLNRIQNGDDLDVQFLSGKDACKVDEVFLVKKNGGYTVDLKGRSLFSRTISDPAEIRRITGSQNRHQIREDGLQVNVLSR